MKKLASTFPNMLLSLTIICLVMGAILGFMNQITEKPIKEADSKAKTAAIERVVPAFDNQPLEEVKELEIDGLVTPVYVARKGADIVGYAIEASTKNGFNGLVKLMVGITAEGILHDFAVLEHGETPGLGAKMEEWFHLPNASANIRNMQGVDLKANTPLKVSKDGGNVDAITASTITSRAFLDAINRAFSAYQQSVGIAPSVTMAKGEGVDGQTAATAASDQSAQKQESDSEETKKEGECEKKEGECADNKAAEDNQKK